MSFYFLVFHLGVLGKFGRGNLSFADSFETYDGDFWELKDGSMHCSEDECALALKENVQYAMTPAIAGVTSVGYELRLLLKDNCQRTTMPCCRNEKCYIFTTGIISSKNVYGYGSYAFIGTSAREEKKRNTKMQVRVRSCFGLKKRDGNIRNEIMYCFSSENTHTAELIVIRGETRYHKTISLGFDSSVHPAVYRIEWQWETIQFVVNSHVKKTLIGAHMIPKEPLHIKVLLLPKGPTGIEQNKQSNIIFTLKTVHIQHKRFITTGPQSKDEMLFYQPPKQVFGPITKIMGSVFLIGSMCCLFFYLKRHSTTTNRYEIFINERL